MKAFIKNHWKSLVFFAIVGLVGGFFTGIYMLDSYPPEIAQQIYDQGLDDILLGLVTAVQSAGYGIVLGALGIFFAEKTGLWKNGKTIERKPLTAAVLVGILGGLALILSDILFFGRYSEAIMNSYAAKPSPDYIIASVLYGGVIEEVMLRLFLMSLLAFVLNKLFGRKAEKPGVVMLVVANIISAGIFAAGHLPATALLLGLSPMIIFRCFLLNGVIGLFFGRLYRRHGLRYAMIAHGGCHIVSKLLWIILI